MEKRTIVALDGLNQQDILYYSLLLKDDVYAVKLNDAIFNYGSKIVSQITNHGIKVMADCKFYDIHNTINNNIKPLINCGAEIITVHGAAQYIPNDELLSNKLAAVTVLTSFSDKDWQVLYDMDLCESILRYTNFAVENNYGYVVCSPLDLKKKLLKELIENNNIKTICPGIRLQNGKNDEHNSAVTPLEAFDLGVDYIVMGRSLLNLSFEKMMHTLDQINNGKL